MAYDLSDYVDVAERVQKFHDTYPEGSLQSEWSVVELNGTQTICVKAYAYRTADDQRPGIGHATEPVPGLTQFTKNSELMVGETSAWGRALAALGFEVKRGIASREEVENRRDADGGGEPGESEAFHNSAPVSTGFVSEKQRAYFDRLIGQVGWTVGERATVTRYLEQTDKATVSAAIDSLKDKNDAELEGLAGEAADWAAKISDVPYDESQ